MKTRLLDEIDKFLSWWADGLSLIVPERWRNRRQRLKRYLLLHLDDDEVVVEHFEQSAEVPATRRSIPIRDGADQSLAREWFLKSPQLLTLPTILRLAPSRVLVKRLRYPSTVRDDLKNVISFDIDRQTPFSREDVYFAFDDVTTNDKSEHRDVDLFLIPKVDLESIESILNRLGLRPTIMDIEGRTFFQTGVNLLPDQAVQNHEAPPHRLRFALFVLWMILVALIPGKQIIDSEVIINHLENQERTGIAAVRPLNKLKEDHARLVEKLNFFDELETEHIRAIDVLNEVTQLLSNNTWIRRFDLKNGTLTLHGESNNAAEIPGILEASERFEAPKYSSPVTRNNATGSDRFQIIVTIDTSDRR